MIEESVKLKGGSSYHKYILGYCNTSVRSTPNDRIFGKLFLAVSFTLKVLARNLLRGRRRRNIFIFSF